MGTPSEWTETWPTEVGVYLFYGDLNFKRSDSHFIAKFYVLEVWEIANGIAYVSNGQFAYPREGYGMFRKFTDLPPY